METERERKTQKREDPQDCSLRWSQLPNNLKEEVLAWLPLERLCRYCGVCKEWNALFSSTQFISHDWVAAPPNKTPRLVLQHETQSLDFTAYCFFTNTWKTLSFAFLRQKYDVLAIWVHGWAAGLFLVSIFDRAQFETVYAVCNPLTGTSLQLPKMMDGVIRDINMVAGEDTYKVIAIVKSIDHRHRVEIFNSSLKSWSTAGDVPQNFVRRALELEMPVVSENNLYWKAAVTESMGWGIAGFNVQNGTFFFIPFEKVHDVPPWFDALFTCGSRVLVASCTFNLGGVIIWEIERPNLDQRDERGIREIARMPQSILEHFQRKAAVIEYPGIRQFDFQGRRDMVYIRYECYWGNELLVYNLCQNTWTWLPTCPRDLIPFYIKTNTPQCGPSMFVFEPRLDVKIE